MTRVGRCALLSGETHDQRTRVDSGEMVIMSKVVRTEDSAPTWTVLTLAWLLGVTNLSMSNPRPLKALIDGKLGTRGFVTRTTFRTPRPRTVNMSGREASNSSTVSKPKEERGRQRPSLARN